MSSYLTYGGDRGDDLAQLELVEDGGLAGGVQPHHQDPHLLLAEEALEQGGEEVAHVASAPPSRSNSVLE